ncbi:mechanosensitive ion channel family protein [Larsenimonas suaedae]|uniref:Mechanosensitive ion channel n=1 Tax=Larsenimonas suaedae TaxID=1851019 RepID=A0ABU1GUQ1_9GAMM|nr:mechanosensitive ion channel domain-containing protein [Larsenimonas suaedae]MCM2971660.1 mechanosensitive ion channel family protein [Larsenimonas suaedae]MDR5895212.1 mechanosensitive ion channel [Larsenimonas suaedae]
MIDTFIENVGALPQWAYALGIAVLTVAAHAGLEALHCTIKRVFNGRLRLVSAVAIAVHPPLVWLAWVYGVAFSLYFLVPSRLGWHGPLLITANLIAALLLLWLIVRVTRRMVAVMDRWAEDRTTAFERFLLPLLTRTTAALAPVLLLFALLPLFIASERIDAVLHNLASLLLIASVAGVMIQGVNMTERLLSERYRMDVENNLVARRVHTQITVLRKLINFLIILLALASMLMIFDKVRQLGTSILASAGILGVVLGFAAQKVFGNLIAGIQIALTQPIRLDDAVVVEGEWGWVEELTLTYVVIRLWDWRRLVLPINYFIDHPFQNWTRTSNDLIGSVILYADYYLPLDELQAEAERLAQLSPRWSGKVCKVQLLEMTERNMQLRVLISARGGADTFDLRCELREGLIRYIAAHYPDALPKVRLETGQRATASSPTLHDTIDDGSPATDH